MKEGDYIPLHKMEIYQLARELSGKGWNIYQKLHWHDKKILGDQFIRATDSVGANFAEGYGRYHHLERVKFCYNSRGSLFEAAQYWLELLLEREKIDKQEYDEYQITSQKLRIKLNNFIAAIYKNRS